jgi:hypothetical protein
LKKFSQAQGNYRLNQKRRKSVYNYGEIGGKTPKQNRKDPRIQKINFSKKGETITILTKNNHKKTGITPKK